MRWQSKLPVTVLPAMERTRHFNVRHQLVATRLMVLVSGANAFAQAELALSGGADAIQLRDKDGSDRERLARARNMVALCRAQRALVFINDRVDIAQLAGADGAHLGQEDLPLAEARILAPGLLLGASTHDDREVEAAISAGADYLGIGSCYPSSTKLTVHHDGLGLVGRWCQRLTLPIFALGGITAERLPEVLARGARAVAIGAAITAAPDPRAAAVGLARILHASGLRETPRSPDQPST
jgi:thiamine-phosphate pyrophosphorylase